MSKIQKVHGPKLHGKSESHKSVGGPDCDSKENLLNNGFPVAPIKKIPSKNLGIGLHRIQDSLSTGRMERIQVFSLTGGGRLLPAPSAEKSRLRRGTQDANPAKAGGGLRAL
jgi:hypothetical protein